MWDFIQTILPLICMVMRRERDAVRHVWADLGVVGKELTSPPTPTKTRLTLATTSPFRTSCTFWRVQGSAWDVL